MTSKIPLLLLNPRFGLTGMDHWPIRGRNIRPSCSIQVIDVMSSMVLANVSSPRPVFMITGLNPGRDLRLLVFATNKNGRSDPTVLEGFTTKVAQLQVGMLENIFRSLNIFLDICAQNVFNRNICKFAHTRNILIEEEFQHFVF